MFAYLECGGGRSCRVDPPPLSAEDYSGGMPRAEFTGRWGFTTPSESLASPGFPFTSLWYYTFVLSIHTHTL